MKLDYNPTEFMSHHSFFCTQGGSSTKHLPAHGLIYAFFLSFFLLAFNSGFASSVELHNRVDTFGPGIKEHKMNQAQFLEKYGRDDSSRALINSFFVRRGKSGKMTFISLAAAVLLTTFTAIVVDNYSHTQPTRTDDYGIVFFVLFFGSLAYTTVVLTIVGTVWLMLYSRRKLLRLLKNYFAGQPLPGGITKNARFRRWMPGEHIMKYRRHSLK